MRNTTRQLGNSAQPRKDAEAPALHIRSPFARAFSKEIDT